MAWKGHAAWWESSEVADLESVGVIPGLSDFGRVWTLFGHLAEFPAPRMARIVLFLYAQFEDDIGASHPAWHMTQRYAHLSKAHLDREMKAFAEAMRS